MIKKQIKGYCAIPFLIESVADLDKPLILDSHIGSNGLDFFAEAEYAVLNKEIPLYELDLEGNILDLRLDEEREKYWSYTLNLSERGVYLDRFADKEGIDAIIFSTKKGYIRNLSTIKKITRISLK